MAVPGWVILVVIITFMFLIWRWLDNDVKRIK